MGRGMTSTQEVPVIDVDFNDIYDDDYVLTARDNIVSPYEVHENDLVELREGHTISCWARVVSASEHLLRCKIEWPTWREESITLSEGTNVVPIAPRLSMSAHTKATVCIHIPDAAVDLP
jgi:hypothetical protein